MTNEYKDEWRSRLDAPVHPFADMFPMIEGEELDRLVADIKANGVKVPVLYFRNGVSTWFIDGRNRYRAAEIAGVPFEDVETDNVVDGDPIAAILSLNTHRRHLTKAQSADLIVRGLEAQREAQAKAVEAAIEAPKPVAEKPVSEPPAKHKGGRGRKSEVRQEAVAIGKATGHSESTMRGALARHEAEKQGKAAPKRDRAKAKAAKSEPPSLIGIVDDIVAAVDVLDIATLDKHLCNQRLIATIIAQILSTVSKRLVL